MAKFGVYSIRDAYTGFLNPTFEISDVVAKRNFTFAMAKKDTLLYSNAQDYDLCRIGEFDSDTGELIPTLPDIVCTGLSVKAGVDCGV